MKKCCRDCSRVGNCRSNRRGLRNRLFVANAPLDKTMVTRHMEVNPKSFQVIKGAIQGCKDGKLRTVKDHLDDVFSYNQIA